MKALIAGWFSFENGGATAGDLLARDLACEWLKRAGCSYDGALASPFLGGVDWRSVDPETYSQVVFVCGPVRKEEKRITELLRRFVDSRTVGLNLSMLETLDVWNPFDLLLERDSPTSSRPDITFLSARARVPVVGVVLVGPQPEYEGKAVHQAANEAIGRLVASRGMSVVPIDTRLDANCTGLRSPAEVESLIARMDVVLTTRLHGMVLALKNGVPAVAIDAIAGGAKVKRQAGAIGWPVVFTADSLTDEALREAFDYCLTEEARAKADECRERAARRVREEVRDAFISALVRCSEKMEDF